MTPFFWAATGLYVFFVDSAVYENGSTSRIYTMKINFPFKTPFLEMNVKILFEKIEGDMEVI